MVDTKNTAHNKHIQYTCSREHLDSQMNNSGFNHVQHKADLYKIMPYEMQITADMSIQQSVEMVEYIRSWNLPNVLGARVPIVSKWNLQLASQLAESQSDREVVQYLRYGWPLNHDGRAVSVTLMNHKSALNFQNDVTNYIKKEMQLGCLLGPFISIPWTQHTAISPMSTREKRNSTKRRILMDLSWPRNGKAVNDGISAEKYMGHLIDLHYPTVDDLCKRAYKLGQGCKGYRRDLGRAFKQLYCDPADWPLMGISWSGMILYDKTTIMGSRSAPYCCQRTTSFIRHIMKNLQHYVANYVDDFMGLDKAEKIWSSYNTLGNLLRDLGVQEALDKAIPPSYIIEFLGVMYDFIKMIIYVTDERMQDFQQELTWWRLGKKYTRKQLESLLGKMQFISNCIRPARVFVLRLRNSLRDMKTNVGITDEQMMADLDWWVTFLPKYNGVSIMWMNQELKEDFLIASDACLTGMGAKCGKEYIHTTFPRKYRNTDIYKIHHLEMIAIIVSVRVWASKLKGFRFVMGCDNLPVVHVVNAGFTKDVVLQNMMRELIYTAATQQFEIVLKYIPSRENKIPDILSRIHLGRPYIWQFEKYIPETWTRMEIKPEHFSQNLFW